MRQFSGLEKCILFAAGLFIICGLISLVHPVEMVIIHVNYRRARSADAGAIEHVSKTGAMAYGLLGITIGAGLIWAVCAGKRK